MVTLNTFDYLLIFLFFAVTLVIGVWVSKKSTQDSSSFFLSQKNMPWWLLGLSMVATTFSTDTPNLVTDIVRNNGVAGNWVWWIFLITGLFTVFIYAKLWRKSNINTDLEFYELRYGGKPASFLRMFRSVYLGVIFNVLAMAGVTLAAIKIGEVMLGLSPWQTVLSAGLVTMIFSAIGGFKGVVYSDFLLFFVAMFGATAAAVYLVNLPEVGGLKAVLTHENTVDKLHFFPSLSNTEAMMTLIVIPLAVQWWSSWYPGAEPGGGGYIAQRMLAAKNENHAMGATLFFNIIHYALRPWPWIMVALASLIVYPDLQSITKAFPNIHATKVGHDLAYPAMLTKLPNGLLGLVLASLVAAYMSTISTHLNWGASYIVNDVYKHKLKPKATEKELVNIGRLSTVFLMVLSTILALYLNHAKQLFDVILMFGAGTGLIFLLRWFWWRINAWSEISAMLFSGVISILFTFTSLRDTLFYSEHAIMPSWMLYPTIVLLTTLFWLLITFLTPPESNDVLFAFYKKIQPGGNGWNRIILKAQQEDIVVDSETSKGSISQGILAVFLGMIAIYGVLFFTGYCIYGKTIHAVVAIILTFIATLFLFKIWNKIKAFVF